MNTIGNTILINSDHPLFTQVLELDRLHFPRPWSDKDWYLNWENYYLLCWDKKEIFGGFALFTHLPGDDTTHLLKICLPPELRGKEDAHLFWKSCMDFLNSRRIKSIFLEVELHNSRAIGFYQKEGFKTLHHHKGYYSDGSDAISMSVTC